VGLTIKIAWFQDFKDSAKGLIFEQDGAEYRLFRLQILGGEPCLRMMEVQARSLKRVHSS